MFTTDEQAIEAFIDADGGIDAQDEQMVSPSLYMVRFGQTRGLAMENDDYIVRIAYDECTGPTFPAMRDYRYSGELSRYAAELSRYAAEYTDQ